MRVDDPAATTTAEQYGMVSFFFRLNNPGNFATSKKQGGHPAARKCLV